MVSEKVKILYVDDEENNLIAFRANFKREYEVYTAISAEIALSLLESNSIYIIISDERMPHITGVEFLEKVAKLYPDTVRLLITGHSDIDIVIQAINRGQVSKFIHKPWDWEKLEISIDHCVTIYKSRTELKLKNEELQKTNDELNKFVYSVSHDLRSPLTSILGLINLTKLKPELRVADTYFDMIENRVMTLDNSVKKIIDYYKNARSEGRIEEVNLNSIITEIWNNLKNENKTINFEFVINGNPVIFSDIFRLQIIFENLISNAIKYQNPSEKKQTIKINIDVTDKNARVLLSDNGIGISDEYLKSIFNLFFRTNNSSDIEGSGIGLYLVKDAIDKIGGKIEVSSKVMVGTSFDLTIPNRITL